MQVVQIMSNRQARSTGVLSPTSCSMAATGTAVRTFTTAVAPSCNTVLGRTYCAVQVMYSEAGPGDKDAAGLAAATAAFLCQVALLLQIYWYRTERRAKQS